MCRTFQPINVTWVSLNTKTPQQRAIAYAIYIGCSNLGATYGNQIFRAVRSAACVSHCIFYCKADTILIQADAPLYRKAWAACLALGALWLASTIFQTVQYKLSNRRILNKVERNEKVETIVDGNGEQKVFKYLY